MYPLLRAILFLFEPEKAHHFTFKMLILTRFIPGLPILLRKIYQVKHPGLKKNLFGITFENPVGLAAGLDKDAIAFNELGNLGFGFVEIGTVTPKAQTGNEKPRLFRLKKDHALINRMGFNNLGAQSAAIKLAKGKNKGLIIGGNIGKNKATPNEEAIKDYEYCFNELYPVVDYFVVNVSSPNTPNLRELQEKEPLKNLLQHLQGLNKEKISPKPILLKIAPDLSENQLDEIVEIVLETQIDGVIATNTTITREGLSYNTKEIKQFGTGGLSGKPLAGKSTEVISYLKKKSRNGFPIIGVGGIHSPEDAIEKIKAGADLIQLYTGFVYEGPSLVKRINKELIKHYAQIN